MKRLLITCLLAGTLSQSLADSPYNYPLDDEVNYSLNNYAASGGVVGAYGGVAWGTRGLLKNAPYDNAYDRKSSGFMGGLSAGLDHAMNDYVSLGIEAGLQYNDAIADSPNGEKFSVFSIPAMVTGKFFIPNTEGLHFVGKAGFAWNRFMIDTPNSKETDKNIGPVIAAGIGFKFHDVAVSLQWQHNWMRYRGKENNYAHIAVGLTYTFPDDEY